MHTEDKIAQVRKTFNKLMSDLDINVIELIGDTNAIQYTRSNGLTEVVYITSSRGEHRAEVYYFIREIYEKVRHKAQFKFKEGEVVFEGKHSRRELTMKVYKDRGVF